MGFSRGGCQEVLVQMNVEPAGVNVDALSLATEHDKNGLYAMKLFLIPQPVLIQQKAEDIHYVHVVLQVDAVGKPKKIAVSFRSRFS